MRNSDAGLDATSALPTGNRRYGRLEVCATTWRITHLSSAVAQTTHLHRLGLLYTFVVKAMRTLFIALLFGFPILGNAADDPPASNWVWELPGERQSFTNLLTDDDFRRVIRQLENRRDEFRSQLESRRSDFMRADFKPLHPLSPNGNAFLHPVAPVVDPTRSMRRSIESAELLNGLRMDGYRRHCEALRHGELQGIPSLYPTQIPFLESP